VPHLESGDWDLTQNTIMDKKTTQKLSSIKETDSSRQLFIDCTNEDCGGNLFCSTSMAVKIGDSGLDERRKSSAKFHMGVDALGNKIGILEEPPCTPQLSGLGLAKSSNYDYKKILPQSPAEFLDNQSLTGRNYEFESTSPITHYKDKILNVDIPTVSDARYEECHELISEHQTVKKNNIEQRNFPKNFPQKPAVCKNVDFLGSDEVKFEYKILYGKFRELYQENQAHLDQIHALKKSCLTNPLYTNPLNGQGTLHGGSDTSKIFESGNYNSIEGPSGIKGAGDLRDINYGSSVRSFGRKEAPQAEYSSIRRSVNSSPQPNRGKAIDGGEGQGVCNWLVKEECQRLEESYKSIVS
jgi:hypothetical protein